MIRVNLIGSSRKKPARAGMKIAMPTSFVPFLLLMIVAGAVAGGYFWYSSLAANISSLDARIASLQKEKQTLDAVIKENQIYEGRKKSLETRIKIVETLKKNKVNPILAMDVLSDAVEKTQFVWLSQLDQNNAVLSMSGAGTSLNAIADFYSNLQNSGYFQALDLANATDASGMFTFSLKCEFKPPQPKPAASAPGGN